MIKILPLILVVICILSCRKELVDKVTLPVASGNYQLAIEGGINSMNQEQFIYISKPSVSLSGNTSPINNAEVSINGIPFNLSATAGVYSGVLPDNKQFNAAYHLRVVYNGIVFEASDSLKTSSLITIDQLNLKASRQNGSVVLSIPKHVFNGTQAVKLFYKLPAGKMWDASVFNVSQNFSYLYNLAPPYGLSPILEQRTDNVLNITDMINLYQFSMSASYERYLYNVFQETDWKSLFSANPGVIKGNISGPALGYFYCSDVTVQAIKVADLIK